MRCVIYGLVLIISCQLIEYTEAQYKNYKKTKDIENGSGERYTKHKEEKIYKGYKYKNNDIEDEEYKINKYDKEKCKGKGCNGNKNKNREVDSELTREEKYSKYTKKFNKYAHDSEENPTNKKNRVKSEFKTGGNERNINFKKNQKRSLIGEETQDTDEEFTVAKRQKIKKNKKVPKMIDQEDEDNSSEEKNTGNHRKMNHKYRQEEVESEADIEEETFKARIKKNIANKIKKSIGKNDENSVEVPKRMVRKQPTSSENESSEGTNENDDESEQTDKSEQNDESEQNGESGQNDTNESDTNEEELERTCKSKSKGRKCGKEGCGINEDSDECDETTNAPHKKKKIKYSIKFAHEKQKISPSENDHIMKKIHKEKKKYKYEDDDDDDDSSEEHVHPKRFRYLDEDEEE